MCQSLHTYPSSRQCGQEGPARQMTPTARPMIFNSPLGTLTDQRWCERLVSMSRLRGISAISRPLGTRAALTMDKPGNQMASDVNQEFGPAHLPSHLVLSRLVTSLYFNPSTSAAQNIVSVFCLPDPDSRANSPYPFLQGKSRRGSRRWERL
ncbi:hypothetical protein LZ32DRAFT_340287 [Colletotrichum eremochloae]|nr:hypothetical protein LZ32DRAFT_340287 [Colletotrichum eremochloae]